MFVFLESHTVDFSRMVSPCRSGPAERFFLLKGSFFSLPLCLPGGLGPCFCLYKEPRYNFIVKEATFQIELNMSHMPLFFTRHLPLKVSVHTTTHITVLTLTFTDKEVFCSVISL